MPPSCLLFASHFMCQAVCDVMRHGHLLCPSCFTPCMFAFRWRGSKSVVWSCLVETTSTVLSIIPMAKSADTIPGRLCSWNMRAQIIISTGNVNPNPKFLKMLLRIQIFFHLIRIIKPEAVSFVLV